MTLETISTILVLGPARSAVSGVSTHLNQLFGSSLAEKYRLVHFQVGSEGRAEGAGRRLLRLAWGPLDCAIRILRSRADCVHLNSSLEPRSYWRDLAFLLVAKTLRRKVIFQVHGGALPEALFAGRPLLTTLLRSALRLPDAVVLLAECELAAYQRFLPGQRLEIIANAIDAAPYLAGVKPPRGQPHRLVYVGRLAESKGIFDMVDALGLLVQRARPCRLTIAGSGPEEPRLRAHVAASGLTNSVEFTGAIGGDDKVRLWLASDLFVFPTFHREGLPYALLESMAAGTPVVTTRVGAMPDVMREGLHGRFVAPHDPAAVADAIDGLLADTAAWSRASATCRQRVAEHYTVDRLARDFDRLYADLLIAPPPVLQAR